ncbi:uncharacterized protein DNG_03123 [Cephalotrichum gorgonifer]|uniref:Azaphilone pigments biosynthesis cluster protein L N-terminal domain-containing protein n=1 Tax=Cephalotrichum gorgonifer TaxID=2041049 RepID=A0AAE8MUJ0_9PEZI|nr:uncharacterized protein DNG_03123 [Cephalotrichum gorgonifer]
MDPLSIATSSFAIAGAVARATIAVVQFSHEAKAAAEDLEAVSRELHALSTILHPLTRSLSGAPDGSVPEEFREQLRSSLEGCCLVVSQIEDSVKKYQRDGAWTRTKWVMFGRGDMEKLRRSLEAYKMALGLGIHVVSMAVGDSIQKDTTELRNETRLLRLNTEEILARVNSLRRHGRRNSGGIQINEWVEDIAILSSYAETTYQESIADETAVGETDIGESAVDPVKARETYAPLIRVLDHPTFDSPVA